MRFSGSDKYVTTGDLTLAVNAADHPAAPTVDQG
jgi:hypothetical protein